MEVSHFHIPTTPAFILLIPCIINN